MTKKKRKKSDRQRAKEAAWGSLSKVVRYAHATDGWNAACVTCGIVKPWKELQAGHWIPKAQGLAVHFEPLNVHPQCYRCNINLGSNGPEYAAYMEMTYGKAAMNLLRQLQELDIKISEAEYQEMKRWYDNQFKGIEMLRQQGNTDVIEVMSYFDRLDGMELNRKIINDYYGK